MRWLLLRLAEDFGVDPARPGEALTPSLRFEQPWSQGVVLLVLVLSLGLVAWVYRREGPAPGWYRALLAAIRMSLVGLALFMIAEGVLSIDRLGLPWFVVLVDESASMSRSDVMDDAAKAEGLRKLAGVASDVRPSRFAVANGWLGQDQGRLLADLLESHKLRFYRVASNAQVLADLTEPAELSGALNQLRLDQPSGAQSRLGSGLRQALTESRGAPPTAILMLTDGQTTEGESLAQAAELAERKGVPLFFIGIGDPRPPRDLVLADLSVDDVVFVNDVVRFGMKLTARGFADQDVTIRLRELDAEGRGPGAEVANVTGKAGPDGETRTFELVHRPSRVGETAYVVEVDQRPLEDRVDNNRIERTIDVREDKLKVLLVDGQPRYEFRYLKSFLERRPETIDLGVVLQSAAPEYGSQDTAALPAFPTAGEGEDGLFSYDVVILGDADPTFFSAAQLEVLATFVTEEGGGLIFASGEYFNPLSYRGTPLEPLLPVQLEGAVNPAETGDIPPPFVLSRTVEGEGSPIFRFDDDEAANAEIWSNLPEHYWYFRAPRKQPAAFVLAELPPAVSGSTPVPLLLYQYVGSGKSMFVGVDDTWRWRLGVGDRYFGRFWVQALRFMARSRLQADREAELTTDRRVYRDQQSVQLRLRYGTMTAGASARPRAQLTGPSGYSRVIELASTNDTPPRFVALVPPPPPGDYQAKLLPPPTLEAEYPTAEFRVEAPAAETERVELNLAELRAAAERTKGAVFLPDAPAADLAAALPEPQKVPLEADPPIPLWNDWRLLTLFVGLLTTEWVLRKRKQMV